jgi:hypothetical protein
MDETDHSSSDGSLAILILIVVSLPSSRSAKAEKAALVRSTWREPRLQPAQVSTIRTNTHLEGPLQTTQEERGKRELASID